MKELPFFQFYPSDFLVDENVILMTNRAIGCYIKLLSHCWLEGSVPSDYERMSILCGESEDDMEEIFEMYLAACFKQNGNRRLTNPRLEKERNKIEQVRKLKSEAGKRGMKARWDKGLDNIVITDNQQPVITKNNYTDTDTDTEKDKDIVVKDDIAKIPFREIVEHLNLKTGMSFRASTKQTQTLIRARWKEGFKLDDFKKVIDRMYDAWGADSKMMQYLRPITLFGTKFEGYLNRPEKHETEGKPF